MGNKKHMRNKFKIVYVVVTLQEEKIIYVETKTISSRELKMIGEKIVELIRKYPNTNVSFKVYG